MLLCSILVLPSTIELVKSLCNAKSYLISISQNQIPGQVKDEFQAASFTNVFFHFSFIYGDAFPL